MTTSPDGAWAIIPDYDAQSRTDYCSASGLRLREGEVGVFRMLKCYIEQEGFADISQYAIEQAARLLGWMPPKYTEDLTARIIALEEELEVVRANTWKAAQNAVKMAGVRAAAQA